MFREGLQLRFCCHRPQHTPLELYRCPERVVVDDIVLRHYLLSGTMPAHERIIC